MSDEGNNGQAPPPGVTPIPDEAAAGAINMVASLVKAFAPDLADEAALQIAHGELTQQQVLGVVLNDAIDTAKRASHHRFGFNLRSLETGEIVATIEAPKDLAMCQDINELKHGVDVLAFSTSPAARSVLRSYGFAIEFFQKKTPSSIIHPQ